MNAITIQKKADETFVLTVPGSEPLIFEKEINLRLTVAHAITQMASDAMLPGFEGTEIPQRLENQSKMIQSFATALNCTPSDSGILNAIANLKRGRVASDKQLMQVAAELDGLNKLFDGVTVERNAEGKITKISASNTVEQNSVCDITSQTLPIALLQPSDVSAFLERMRH